MKVAGPESVIPTYARNSAEVTKGHPVQKGQMGTTGPDHNEIRVKPATKIAVLEKPPQVVNYVRTHGPKSTAKLVTLGQVDILGGKGNFQA